MTMRKPEPAESGKSSAQEQMARLAQTYARVVLQSIGRAQTLLANAGSSSDPVSDLREIFAIFHDMKGQGATFGYALITDIGALVCQAIRGLTDLTPAQRHAVAQALTATRMIVEEQVTGTGGESGRELLAALQRLFELPE